MSQRSGKAVRRAGALATFIGTVFNAVGTAAWVLISQQLREEKITVPPNAPAFGGRQVQDPATAYVQAMVIKRNAERAAGGRTFADVSSELRGLDPTSDEAKELHAHSSSLSTAASLRTSLMMSVLAYGVSAFAMALGMFFMIAGWQLRKAGKQ